jgi:hypothetical protein
MDETVAQIRKEKLRLLHEAVNAHVTYISLAAKAQGVDRHFMGLSMLVQDGEKRARSLFGPCLCPFQAVACQHFSSNAPQVWQLGIRTR